MCGALVLVPTDEKITEKDQQERLQSEGVYKGHSSTFMAFCVIIDEQSKRVSIL